MTSLWTDLMLAARRLRRSPGTSLAIVTTLALGIGANTALFSVVDAVLLRPLPYRQPDRLVALWETVPGRFRVAPANYLDWTAQAHSFESMAAFGAAGFTLTGAGEPERVDGAAVSGRYFETLGVVPALGRAFRAGEDAPGAEKVVVLGHELWQRRFGGDPAILGRGLALDGELHTVVGVMPPGLYPTWASPSGRIPFLRRTQDFWVPLDLGPRMAANRRSHVLGVVARLREGVTIRAAQQEMAGLAQRLAQEHPATNAGGGALVTSLRSEIVGDVEPALLVLLGAVAAVLLLACANVAGLLLARSAARARELAVRRALGAGRLPLVRLVLSESLLLALLGGVAGAALAALGVEALLRALPTEIPRAGDVAVDARVLFFALVLSLTASVAAGLLPALQASSAAPLLALKQAVPGGAGGPGRLRGPLVVGQVAVALVLLTGGTLLARSFGNLREVSPGFVSEGVLAFELLLPPSRYAEHHRVAAAWKELVERLEGLPSVRSAAVAYDSPLETNWIDSFVVEGAASSEQPSSARLGIASPGYFNTLGIPVTKGRGFDERDDASHPGVAVVSDAFARAHFPGEDPIGRVLAIRTPSAIWGEKAPARFEIVGTAGDTRSQGLAAPPEPTFYLAAAQFPSQSMKVLLRTAGDPLALVPAVRETLARLDPELAPSEVTSLARLVDANVAQPRFNALVLAVFAALALTLAAVGLYGLLAHSVALRTREIGVRMALGARRSTVTGLVVRQGLRLFGTGLALGMAGSLAVTRVLSGLLFGVTATDPVSFLAAPLVLTATAAVAAFVPARRAAGVEPAAALRYE